MLDDSSNNLILDDSKVASIFNTFFINISRDLNIEPWETCLEQLGEDLETPDDIDLVLRKFANHPSIRVIHSMKNRDDVFSFSFSHVEPVTVYREILKTKPQKIC